MAAAIEMFAVFGPVVLTIMGLAIALTTPMTSQRVVFAWLIAFVVVGIPASVAAFFEQHAIRDAATEYKPIALTTRPERDAFADRPEHRMHTERPTEHLRVIYGEHRNRMNHGQPTTTLTYEVSQTVHAPVSALAFGILPKTSTVIPPNNFSCVGFTKNPDGSWEAGENTQSFTIGKSANVVIRNQGPIEAGWLAVGGVDLYYLINTKCGAQSAH